MPLWQAKSRLILINYYSVLCARVALRRPSVLYFTVENRGCQSLLTDKIILFRYHMSGKEGKSWNWENE